jgi:hypothetical protein
VTKSVTVKRCMILFGIGLGLSLLIIAAGLKRSKAFTTFTVMNTADGGPGSLRQAILDANANPGADTIDFQAGLTGTITLTSGLLPTISEELTINGPGALVIAVSGNNASGIFVIASGIIVTISDLTISNGFAFTGGGILNNGGQISVSDCTLSGSSSSAGGGIANLGGTVTVTDSTFSGNTASGGGIFNQGGIVTITNCTMSNNFAAGGGGVFNQGGTVTITNSTISNNSATLGGFAMGGGIFIDSGTVNIANSTLSDNVAVDGGGIRVSGGTVNIKNSIVANSTGGDCSVAISGTLNALGVNFSSDGSCPGFTQVTAGQLNLGPLQDNGGPTETHALLSGSVSIDAVADCTDVAGNPVTQDQRGLKRPIDGNCDEIAQCDVGAYEAPLCTVSTFDVCLQDDSNASIVFLGNTQTGAYLFCCGGTVFSGTARVIVKGKTATFQHNSADRRVLAKVNGGSFKGTAALQSPPGRTICTITERDSRNSSCVCQ